MLFSSDYDALTSEGVRRDLQPSHSLVLGWSVAAATSRSRLRISPLKQAVDDGRQRRVERHGRQRRIEWHGRHRWQRRHPAFRAGISSRRRSRPESKTRAASRCDCPTPQPIAIGSAWSTRFPIPRTTSSFRRSTKDRAGEPPSKKSSRRLDCPPFRAPLLGSPLAITQKHNDAYSLPQGIGYALNPNQMIHLELHYINSGSQPVDISAQTQLYPLNEGELVHEASVMVVGNLNVAIPPNSPHTLGPTYKASSTGIPGRQHLRDDRSHAPLRNQRPRGHRRRRERYADASLRSR